MRYVLSIIAAFTLCGQLQAADSDNFENVYVATYGSWKTSRVFDNFDESEIGRSAYYKVGEDGSVMYFCWDSILAFVAYADNFITSSLGNMWKSEIPIEVFIKVDDGEIIETVGKYPNTIVFDPVMVTTVRDEFRSGYKGRIKTVHDDERHTFVLDLRGFTAASEWVEELCN